MKLLEFALIAVSEALRQDPQMELLIEKTPIQNYDSYSSSVEIGQPPFPNPNDDYPYTAKQEVLKEDSKFYNNLLKGLAESTVSDLINTFNLTQNS